MLDMAEADVWSYKDPKQVYTRLTAHLGTLSFHIQGVSSFPIFMAGLWFETAISEMELRCCCRQSSTPAHLSLGNTEQEAGEILGGLSETLLT